MDWRAGQYSVVTLNLAIIFADILPTSAPHGNGGMWAKWGCILLIKYKKKYKILLTFHYKCFTHKFTQPHPLLILDGGGEGDGDVTLGVLFQNIIQFNFDNSDNF